MLARPLTYRTLTLPACLFFLVFFLVHVSCSATQPAESSVETHRVLVRENRRNPADLEALSALARDPNVVVVRALGRTAGPGSTQRLCTALGHSDRRTRLEAIFWLGQIEREADRKTAAGALLPFLGDRDPEVRTRVVMALGKLGDVDLLATLLPLLRDENAAVRGASALALRRLHTSAAAKMRSAKGDRELIERLAAALGTESQDEAMWRITYALAGIRRPQAAAMLLETSQDRGSVNTRVFALRGLARLALDHWQGLDAATRARFRDRFLEALKDTSPRVRIEACRGLGGPSPRGRDSAPRERVARFEERAVLVALLGPLFDENPHVTAAAVRAIGHFDSMPREVNAALGVAMASDVTTVRTAAIEATARHGGGQVESQMRLHARSRDWRVRKSVAGSLRFLPDRAAIDLARELIVDTDYRVCLATLEALGELGANRATMPLAIFSLEIADPALREEAARLLAKVGDSSVVPALRRSYRLSEGPDYADARQAIVTALGQLGRGNEDTRTFLSGALEDSAYHVRKAAHAALSAFGDEQALPPPRRPTELWIPHLPAAGELDSFLASRPHIALRTDKGEIVIELWPRAAPNHCFNLLRYVESGSYDGRIFHRVVPNFVVQGGDARGDGYGAKAFLGGRLRDEINPEPFLTGTVGMPKTPQPDSGGEQIFITTVPTPHLDGRYTAFGRVVAGLENLLRIEVGDRIRRAIVVSR